MAIVKFENFLEGEMYEKTVDAAENALTIGENLFSTNYSWNKSVKKDSYPVLCHNLDKHTFMYEDIKWLIESKTGYTPQKGHILLYYWTRHSYIPWHRDSYKVIENEQEKYIPYDAALTVYLNREWDKDSGGYFLYEDNDEIKAILPKRNLGILQYDSLYHSTTPVNYDGDVKITLQVFLKKKNVYITVPHELTQYYEKANIK